MITRKKLANTERTPEAVQKIKDRRFNTICSSSFAGTIAMAGYGIERAGEALSHSLENPLLQSAVENSSDGVGVGLYAIAACIAYVGSRTE